MDPISTIFTVGLALVALLLSFVAASNAHDAIFATHMSIFAVAATLTIIFVIRACNFSPAVAGEASLWQLAYIYCKA